MTGQTDSPAAQEDTNIPDHVYDSMARCLLPIIQQYYESEEGRKAFAEWKAQRDKEAKHKPE